MGEATGPLGGKLVQIVGGVLVLGLAGVVIWDSLSGSEGGATEAWDLTVSASSQLAPDRFAYSERLNIKACAASTDAERVCLGAMGRGGAWLGEPRALAESSGGCWSTEVSAAELSDAHYGPLWVVAVSGASDCRVVGELSGATQGQQQPRVALAKEVARQGWSWGASRIYIHDKLQ